MSITGTGTEADPYVVDTFKDLLSKISTSKCYIELKNDVDLLAEYPDGLTNVLEISANVDGKGHKIHNFAVHDCDFAIKLNVANMKNVKFTNIDCKRLTKSFMTSSGSVSDCCFVGSVFSQSQSNYDFFDGSGKYIRCATKIKGEIYSIAYLNATIKYCYLEFDTDNLDCVVHSGGNKNTGLISSYLKIKSDNIKVFCSGNSGESMSNSVIDINTNSSISFEQNGDKLSIFNSTHAPNATAGNGFAAVSEEDWINVQKLQEVGFSAT